MNGDPFAARVANVEKTTSTRTGSCNRHANCAKADEEARLRGRTFGAEHCHDECCEECFGY